MKKAFKKYGFQPTYRLISIYFFFFYWHTISYFKYRISIANIGKKCHIGSPLNNFKLLFFFFFFLHRTFGILIIKSVARVVYARAKTICSVELRMVSLLKKSGVFLQLQKFRKFFFYKLIFY